MKWSTIRLKVYLVLLVLLVFAVTAVEAGGGGGLSVQRSVIGSAGGHASAGSFQMYSTSGQPVVDIRSNGDVSVRSGFWFWYQYKVMVPVVLRK